MRTTRPSADYDDDLAGKKPYRFQLDAWDAQELKRMLKLQEPLSAIMQWPPAKVQALFTSFQQSSHAWETDYSKLLVFVCGNLDEMRTTRPRNARKTATPMPTSFTA